MVFNTDWRSCIRYPNVFSFKLSQGKISIEPAQDKRSNLKGTGFTLAFNIIRLANQKKADFTNFLKPKNLET